MKSQYFNNSLLLFFINILMLFGCFGENSKQQSTVNKKSIIGSSNKAVIQNDMTNQTRKKQKEFITNIPFIYKEIKKQYDNRWYIQFELNQQDIRKLIEYHTKTMRIKMDTLMVSNIITVNSDKSIFIFKYKTKDLFKGIIELIDLKQLSLLDTMSFLEGHLNYQKEDTLSLYYVNFSNHQDSCLLFLNKCAGIQFGKGKYKNIIFGITNRKHLINSYCVSVEGDKFLLRKANIN